MVCQMTDGVPLQRIITPDLSSILVSSTVAADSLTAYLAHSLVSNARDEAITVRDPLNRRKSRDQSRGRTISIGSLDQQANRSEKSYGDQALKVGRSLLSSVSNATIKGSKVMSGTDGGSRPSLLSRVSSGRPFPTTAMSPPIAERQAGYGSSSTSPIEEVPLPSLELASIVPDESRPPTVLLSRHNLGSFFQSSKISKAKLQTASRFNSSEPPLTDRYGFICEAILHYVEPHY